MQETESRGSNFWPLIIVGGLLAAGVLLRPRASVDHTPQPLPPMMVKGWLNSDGPPDLEGKLLVVDAWFTTCPPCRKSLPRLAALRERFPTDRVEMIGLTFEDETMRDRIAQVIQSVDGFVWPVGYGAQPTLQALNVDIYPTLFLFAPDGVSLWRGHDVDRLAEQIENAL